VQRTKPASALRQLIRLPRVNPGRYGEFPEASRKRQMADFCALRRTVAFPIIRWS